MINSRCSHPVSGKSHSLIPLEEFPAIFGCWRTSTWAKHRGLCGLPRQRRRNEGRKPADFPDEFPVSREMQRETGLGKTACTARQFSRQAESLAQPDKSPDIRGFIASGHERAGLERFSNPEAVAVFHWISQHRRIAPHPGFNSRHARMIQVMLSLGSPYSLRRFADRMHVRSCCVQTRKAPFFRALSRSQAGNPDWRGSPEPEHGVSSSRIPSPRRYQHSASR